MFFTDLARRLFRKSLRRNAIAPRQSTLSVKLAVEGVEDRITPAAITTTTVAPAIEGTGFGFGTTGYLRVSIDTPSSLPTIVTLGYSGSGTNGTDYNANTFATIPAFANYVDVAINPVNNSKATGTLSVVCPRRTSMMQTTRRLRSRARARPRAATVRSP